MASRYQHARRRAIRRGATITILAVTAWCLALGLAEAVTR